jgi:hypothetical protein
MNRPLISVCLPNRNTRPFLPERIDSIFNQSYKSWEVIVSDNFSQDGAWEFLTEVAAKNPRIFARQAPLGIYDGWNDCIRRARGDYIYIATSDDTMAPDCLEKLVTALEEHRECDIAHCNLRVINEVGGECDYGWSSIGLFALSSGPLANVSHVRLAPFDALLLMSGRTVYWSITQLLIRRNLFDKIGFFESTWGSIGDANWQMRACLVANTVHVADTWAGWRVHRAQATGTIDYDSAQHERQTQEMIDHAIQQARPLVSAQTARLQRKWSDDARSLRHFLKSLAQRPSKLQRRIFILRELLSGDFGAALHLRSRSAKQPHWPEAARNWVAQTGLTRALVPV